MAVRTKQYFQDKFVAGYVLKAEDLDDLVESAAFLVDIADAGISQEVLDEALADKVDKVTDKSLILDTLISKLSALPANDALTALLLLKQDAESGKSLILNTLIAKLTDLPLNADLNTLLATKRKVTQAKTGTTIVFTEDAIYNASAPISGNITIDLTGAVVGTTVRVHHNAASGSAVPAGVTNFGGDSYLASNLNIYSFTFEGNSIVIMTLAHA